MSIEEDKDRVESILDNYESIQGISFTQDPQKSEDLNKYLAMSRDQLKSLNITDCAEIAYIFAEYAFYVQRLYNKEAAVLFWAEKKLLEYTCDKLDQFDTYTKHDVKIHCIAKENDVVKKVLYIISYCKQIMERLSFLSTRLHNMGDKLNNLQIAKTSERKALRYE